MSRVIVHNGDVHDELHYEEIEAISQETDRSPEEPVQRYEEPVPDDLPAPTEEPPVETSKQVPLELNATDPKVGNQPVEGRRPAPVNETVQPKQAEVVETSLPTTGNPRPQPDGFRVVPIRPIEPKQVQGPPASVQPPRVDEPIFTIEEVRAVKDLCDRLGADTLLELMDILDL